jgi:microcystin-dependent protein
MKYYTWLFLVLFSTILMAQNSGKGFNYQGVARTIDGQPRGSENIELRFSLIPEIGMNPAWVETHVTTTSPFGVFAVIVGKGIRETGLYSTYQEVSFENHDYWLKIELQEEGQWKELSQFQLPSMPYAEVAHTSKFGGIPPGSIIPFAGPKENIPDGWLLCDGRELDRTQYHHLYSAIGDAWGNGDGATTFDLPDLRSMFLRGVSHGRTRDPDRNNRGTNRTGGNTNDKVGSIQAEDFKRHTHTGQTNNDGAHEHGIWYSSGSATPGAPRDVVELRRVTKTRDDYFKTSDSFSNHRHRFTTDGTGGNETRPDNAYVNYIIKL